MRAVLPGGDHIGKVLDRACPQKGPPMRLARGRRKSCRNRKDRCAGVGQPTVHFRKAQIVTNRQAESTRRRIDRYEAVATSHRGRLPVALVAIRQVDVEKVNLAITGAFLTFCVPGNGGTETLVGAIGIERYAAGDQPHPVAPRAIGQEGLYRTRTGHLGNRELLIVATAHENRVFRQQCKLHTTGARLGRKLVNSL